MVKCKVIAVANQKGGVGKTTTSVNLSCALGELGRRVLLVDLDPQGNATTGSGVDKKRLKSSVYDCITSRRPNLDAIIKTPHKMDVMAGDMRLAASEIELVDMENREYVLRDVLTPLKDSYDFIIIDCPPSLGMLTIVALCAADTVLIPVQCEFYALEGLSQLMGTIRRLKGSKNPELDIEGVLITMYDGRLNLSLQVAQEIKKYFAGKTYKTVIPRNVRLSEAPSFGQPVTVYDKTSAGAWSYRDFAREVWEKNK